MARIDSSLSDTHSLILCAFSVRPLLAAPGFNKQDLHVRVENGLLTIEGKHREERKHEDPNRRFLRTERVLQSVRRTLRLSSDVEQTPARIKARYQDGVLKVRTNHRQEGGRHADERSWSHGEPRMLLDTAHFSHSCPPPFDLFPFQIEVPKLPESQRAGSVEIAAGVEDEPGAQITS